MSALGSQIFTSVRMLEQDPGLRSRSVEDLLLLIRFEV